MGTQPEAFDLVPIKKPNGDFDHWQMVYKGQKYEPPAAYPAIQVAYGEKAEFTVTIKDANPTPGKPITFADKDPIFFHKMGSPNKKTDEFHSVKGEGSPTLTFKDHNWKQDDLYYGITFNNAGQFDPIIENNGGGPPNFQAYLVPVLVGLGLLAVAYFAFRAWNRSRQTR